MSDKAVEKKKKVDMDKVLKAEAEAAIKADNAARKKIENAVKARELAEKEAARLKKLASRYSLNVKDVSFLLVFVAVFVLVSYVFSLL